MPDDSIEPADPADEGPDATAPAPAAEPGGAPPADPSADEVIAAARSLRRGMVLDDWLRRCGIVCTLLLAALALLLYGVRRASGDAAWATHLAWLAWTLPLVAAGLHRAAEKMSPSVDRLRTSLERGLRRGESLPRLPAEGRATASGAGMLAVGAGALLVVIAGTVPVARPKLDHAAVTLSRQALGVEARNQALRSAGVLSPDLAAEFRGRIRAASVSPGGFREAEEKRLALAALEAELDARASRVATEAAEKLRIAETAAALTSALELDPKPGPEQREALPPQAAGTLADLLEEAFGGPAGLPRAEDPSEAVPESVPVDLLAALRRADGADDRLAPANLREAAERLRDRQARLNRLLQTLSEAGFPLTGLRGAASSASKPVDPAALAEALRRAGDASPDTVKAVVDRLR